MDLTRAAAVGLELACRGGSCARKALLLKMLPSPARFYARSTETVRIQVGPTCLNVFKTLVGRVFVGFSQKLLIGPLGLLSYMIQMSSFCNQQRWRLSV